ncbi:hypothetical protein IMZ31_19065 (plasmid) [Pontibacillus sp. ALD_SL1]|uniref:hypothetical protein n=1 Tax=Pontibacillus sp. ALD_SL1 TaxID=2777185 RepID=UPI001A965042|nr:hypothetical protein [Pontibacillus sp. ALD_SL1]QST02651.1 hypothetical protein IMZ31_19065 [Pontibacillus sp. ALD_SL1]
MISMSLRSRWSESWSQYDRNDVSADEVVVPNVRLQSAAGWYIGAVEFYSEEEMDFYSRNTEYYPNEGILRNEYSKSISVEEAFEKVKHHPLYQKKLDQKK